MMQQLLVFLSNAQIKIYQNPREPLCKNVIVSSLGTHMMQWLFFLSNISIQIYGYLSCNKLAIGTHMKQQYQFFLSNRLIEIYGNPWEPTGTHKNPSCKKAIVLAIGTHMKQQLLVFFCQIDRSKSMGTHKNTLCKNFILMTIGTHMMKQQLVFLSNIHRNPLEPM